MADKRWRLVDYDVHMDVELARTNKAEAKAEVVETYGVIYSHLDPVALRFTDSVYMIPEEVSTVIEAAFLKINADLAKRELAPVEFNVTLTDAGMADVMRRRAVKSLNEQVRGIAVSLLNSIEALEAKFNEVTDDVNKHLYKTRLQIAQAKRDLEEARGLATLFLIEGDTKAALDATLKVIEIEADKRQMKKALAKAVDKAEAKG